VHLSELTTNELQQFKIQVQKVIDLVWLFMELHMLKVMMLSVMLLCVFDVSGAWCNNLAQWQMGPFQSEHNLEICDEMSCALEIFE
jgi:hypothetical protein